MPYSSPSGSESFASTGTATERSGRMMTESLTAYGAWFTPSGGAMPMRMVAVASAPSRSRTR